jgi:hypothetical protein
MNSDFERHQKEYTSQNFDIINALINIPYLASKLEVIDSAVNELKQLIQSKFVATTPSSVKTADWKSRELVSIKDCAVILNQSPRTVKDLVKRNFLEESRATRHRKITTRSLRAYVDRTV